MKGQCLLSNVTDPGLKIEKNNKKGLARALPKAGSRNTGGRLYLKAAPLEMQASGSNPVPTHSPLENTKNVLETTICHKGVNFEY